MKNYIVIIFLSLSSPFSVAIDVLSSIELEKLLLEGIVINSSMSEADIKEQLGAPIEKVLIGDEDDKPEVQYFDLIYSGLKITFYEFKGSSKIVYIKSFDNKYNLGFGLHIGMDVASVKKAFSNADEYQYEEDGLTYLIYQSWKSVHDQIIFEVKAGKVKSISWSNMP